jgi:class 3 adenylate cyclase
VTAAVETALSLPGRLEQAEPSSLAGLRIGVHRGPALAATLNDQLDYFGTTARDTLSILSQAGNGELVLTQAVAADPEVAALLNERGIATEVVPTSLPGHRHLIRVRFDHQRQKHQVNYRSVPAE